jgi:NAD-specific glutamate dehydrogenase
MSTIPHGFSFIADSHQGGVTSSSLEVLAGLSLTDEEYTESMMFKDGKPSAFCKLRTPLAEKGS